MRARLVHAIDIACDWYCDVFGTEAAFTVALLLFVAWVIFIPILGWEHWNIGLGLLGNTTESTAELFFAIATLVVARKISVQQRAERLRDEAILQRLEDLAELIHDHQLRSEK